MTLNYDINKEVRYLAMKLVVSKGITKEEAQIIAAKEIEAREASLKKSKRDTYAQKERKKQKQKNEINKKKRGTVYTVNGKVVNSVVQGGSPGQGKKS
jgi:RecJ-like exonuclease